MGVSWLNRMSGLSGLVTYVLANILCCQKKSEFLHMSWDYHASVSIFLQLFAVVLMITLIHVFSDAQAEVQDGVPGNKSSSWMLAICLGVFIRFMLTSPVYTILAFQVLPCPKLLSYTRECVCWVNNSAVTVISWECVSLNCETCHQHKKGLGVFQKSKDLTYKIFLYKCALVLWVSVKEITLHIYCRCRLV